MQAVAKESQRLQRSLQVAVVGDGEVVALKARYQDKPLAALEAVHEDAKNAPLLLIKAGAAGYAMD